MRTAYLALPVLAGLLFSFSMEAQQASTGKSTASMAWMNPSLPADTRADLMLHEMTLDEKIQLVHGAGGVGYVLSGVTLPKEHNGGAGFVPGIPRLHLPDINIADSSVGVRMGALQSRYSTLLPSVLGLAASWNPDAAFLYGAVIGRELRDQGYNMSIGGGVNLIREPRNGRAFEYASEEPVLSGVVVGQLMHGLQAQQVMGDLKHFVLNDQETHRETLNAVLNLRALKETDLLAFQIAINIAQPAAIMCAYNRVNGDYACENELTLNKILKQEMNFKGWVMSDWGGTHSTVKAAMAGLDQEQAGGAWFGNKLKEAILSGQIPQSRLDNMVHRILRSMFAVGVIDHPPVRRVVDPFVGRDDARKIEEQSIVLLRNENHILPLTSNIRKIAVIGGHANVGVLSGGGSAQVDSPGGNAADPDHGAPPWDGIPVYFPTAPLRFLREGTTTWNTTITYNDGKDIAEAAAEAASAEVAIVFAEQWMAEGHDAATLSLPGQQDELIASVAKANPNTIVVLETGGPVKMPWAKQLRGILEAWYPGIGGGEAIANILLGKVNPSAKLPVTFPADENDLPHPHIPGMLEDGSVSPSDTNVLVSYDVEGLTPGYRWFQIQRKKPLFPFGYGLSYTQFQYSHLEVVPEKRLVRFEIVNTGNDTGDDIAQIYVTLPNEADEPFRKLVGWKRISLRPKEKQMVEVSIPSLYLSVFSVEKNSWQVLPGNYRIEVGSSSESLHLSSLVPIK